MSLPADLLDACRERGLRIVTAESCTGGMIAAALTDIPGSSEVVDRGFITYSNAAKTEMLGVAPEMIEAVGAVSEEVARAMAEGALAQSRAEIAIAVTGVAGPGASDRKPEGMVWFALAQRGRQVHAFRRDFGAVGRAQVRASTVEVALEACLEAVRGEKR